MIGDKRGRLSVLFGSIITYSVANLLNGAVDSINQYAACRLVAGIGLAGELGAGITLVSELMDKQRRGIATAIVAGFGINHHSPVQIWVAPPENPAATRGCSVSVVVGQVGEPLSTTPETTLTDVAVMVSHRFGRVPDDRAHNLAVRYAAELISLRARSTAITTGRGMRSQAQP